MKYITVVIMALLGWIVIGQSKPNRDNKVLDENYREDQFYISITYNVLNKRSSSVTQTGFSPGLHFGFIRDMPINPRRNLAIGIGLGLSANTYNQNLSIIENANTIEFTVYDDRVVNVARNRFSTYLLELPIEFRWRTSTATEYSFWRIYTGFKFGYMFYNNSVLKSSVGDARLENLDAFNRFQYGITLSAGFNTWNAHFYYNLSTLFDNQSQINGQPIEISAFKIGLIFYIL